MVLPSSALLNCTAVYLTSILPHSGHVIWMTASFCISLRSTVWIADLFCLRSEGKEEAFVVVVIVSEAVSTTYQDLPQMPVRMILTFVLCSTTPTYQNGVLISSRIIEEIAAVCAEDERPNCRHLD